MAFAGTLGLRTTVPPRAVVAVISPIRSRSCSPGTSVIYTGPPLRHLAAAWNPANGPTVWNISQSGTTFRCRARIPLKAFTQTCQPCASSFSGWKSSDIRHANGGRLHDTKLRKITCGTSAMQDVTLPPKCRKEDMLQASRYDLVRSIRAGAEVSASRRHCASALTPSTPQEERKR